MVRSWGFLVKGLVGVECCAAIATGEQAQPPNPTAAADAAADAAPVSGAQQLPLPQLHAHAGTGQVDELHKRNLTPSITTPNPKIQTLNP